MVQIKVVARSRFNQLLSNLHHGIDAVIYQMRRASFAFLQYSVAIVFIWFGALKLIGQSPAAEILSQTYTWSPGEWLLPFVGIWEMTTGLLMVWKRSLKLALVMLFLLIPTLFLPLLFNSEAMFQSASWALTMEGQYIVKNIVLISAAIALSSLNRPTP